MNSQVQFMHYRRFVNYTGYAGDIEVDSRGGATVAILPAENNTVLVSIARCNPNDVFNKKVGRAISEGRIQAYLNGRTSLEGTVRSIVVTDLLKLKETVADAISDVMEADDLY